MTTTAQITISPSNINEKVWFNRLNSYLDSLTTQQKIQYLKNKRFQDFMDWAIIDPITLEVITFQTFSTSPEFKLYLSNIHTVFYRWIRK